MPMSALFLATFVLGLLLAVYAMLHGVERPPRVGPEVDAFGRAMQAARTSLKAPTAAAFLTTFGAVGYSLHRSTTLGTAALIVVAGISGAIAILCVVLFIAKVLIPAARHDVVDERFLLMGHLARVATPIGGGDAIGEIIYDLAGTRHAVKARSVDGASVPVGTDVVIERVEDGVAFVEPWVQVEQRI